MRAADRRGHGWRGKLRLVVGGLLALGWLLCWPRSAEAGAFVRLSELVERYGLEAELDVVSGRQVLTAGGMRLVIVPGMRQLLVGERVLALPEPVVCAEGDLLVPAAAAHQIAEALGQPPAPRTAPAPALAAARAPVLARPSSAGSAGAPRPEPRRHRPSRRAGAVIALDPGHGGKFDGARGHGLVEKDVNLAIVRHLQQVLEQRGYRVVLTRSEDRELNDNLNADLDARVAVANGARAQVFVSVHANYAADCTVAGFEVFHHGGSAESGALARAIHAALARGLEEEDRGVKTAGFRVVRRARMPAVLVEVGFLSHAPTARRLATEAYRRRLAEAIAEGIEDFLERS
ncbi:MAG: hypothetical protein KatS3mg102_2550 [Planctomycetota bacterium]|nr:MAG: hypothetical protein KatS3mg102_2550 [Planctomycetota bacterium]